MSFNDYNDDLQQIGIYFGTDKYDHNHSFAGKSYLHIYNNYFKHLRTNPVNFLEIGVKDGQSHRMWSKYFHSNSKIYGLDIDPRCSVNTSNNIKIFIGSQADENIKNEMINDCNDYLDVVLDDGSHINTLTIESFNLFWPHLRSGGLYVIEDLGCSYLENDTKEHITKWPGMHYNTTLEHTNNRETMNQFFNSIIEKIDKSLTNEFEWIHFYSKICIIKKQG
jgi:hypothetical protein